MHELIAQGHRVWATVRSERDETDLLERYGDAVDVLRMDVTDEAAVRAAADRVAQEGPVNGLVNNAGAALVGPLEYLPVETFRKQIEVNLIGQLTVTQAFLPALRRARELGQPARIVTIGSIGGRIAGPMLGPYHASKFGIVGLTDTLRAELAPSGIEVILIEPGAIATPIWGRGLAEAERLQGELPEIAVDRYGAQMARARKSAHRSAEEGLPPADAAKVVVAALTRENPRPRQLLGRDAKIASIVARLPSRLRYRLTAARA